MFSAVGTSVAMGNAQETVKAAATYVTTAVDDDGIYNAAKHFGLMYLRAGTRRLGTLLAGRPHFVFVPHVL